MILYMETTRGFSVQEKQTVDSETERISILPTKTSPRSDCDIDHKLLMSSIREKPENTQTIIMTKYNLNNII